MDGKIPRSAPRQRRRLRVVVAGSHAMTGDVAVDGFCAETMKVLPGGTAVDGTITIGGRDFDYAGVVRWSRPGDLRIRLPGRMGVRFTKIAPEFRALFDQLYGARS